MSVSMTVRTHKPSIETQSLKQAINDSLRNLLFQADDFRPHIEIERELIPIGNTLIPDGKLFSVYEGTYLDYGLLCCYEKKCQQDKESKFIEYEFSVLEIPRNFDDMLFAFSVSICIGAAKYLGESYIIDIYGVLGHSDNVAIEKVLSAALTERLPLSEALRVFYSRLPV